MKLPTLIPGEDYRAEHDGGDSFLSPSTKTSLCLYCGTWYGWDEVHGQIIGGCYPPAKGGTHGTDR